MQVVDAGSKSRIERMWGKPDVQESGKAQLPGSVPVKKRTSGRYVARKI